tara:strand:- start:2875 stop:4593 length:1719 start_codon:yes stop_codon:yes gene_type:complete
MNFLKKYYLERLKLIRMMTMEVGVNFLIKFSILSIFENILDLLSLSFIITLIFSQDKFLTSNIIQLSLEFNILLLLIFIALKAISRAKLSIIKNRMILNLNQTIRDNLFSDLINSPLDIINSIGKSEALASLRNNVSKTIACLVEFVNLIRGLFSLIIFLIAFLSFLDYSIFYLIIGVSITFGTAFFQKPKNWEIGSQLNKLNLSTLKTISEGIYGLKTIKSMSYEDKLIKKLSKDTNEFNNLSDKSVRIESFFNVYIDFLIAFLVIAWITFRRDFVEPSFIVATLFIAYRTVSSFTGIIKSYRMCLQLLPGYRDLILVREKIIEKKYAQKKSDHISFTYKFDKEINNSLIRSISWVFRNDSNSEISNLDFSKEKFAVIVGPSGSGKTSLLDKFCGLKNISKSSWKLKFKNDNNFFDLNISSQDLNCFIAYSIQETHLFEGSIYQNLIMGRNNLNQKDKKEINEEINFWLNKLGLLKRFSQFDIYEDNMKLFVNCFSGGEIQRMGIVRNILAKKPIEVFDEPTAYLDDFWANKVSEFLLERSKQKVVIVSTHDPRIISKADNIIPAGDYFDF